jgi:hypothetical protein
MGNCGHLVCDIAEVFTGENDCHQNLARKGIRALADSLAVRPELREQVRSSPEKRDLLQGAN